MTIEALAGFFSNTMEESQSIEVLDISDARALQAHTDGLCQARSTMSQLALQNGPATSGDMELGLNTTVPQTLFYTKMVLQKFGIRK